MELQTANYLLGIGTFLLQIVTVGIILIYVLRKNPFFARIAALIGTWGLSIAFLATLVSSALTLYYSEVLGIEPCPLCWWQRVFLYSQVVLFALALWRRESRIALYSIVLSIFGLGFALYHHALQVLPSGTLPCPATGVSCAARFMYEFNYITYPLMAATLFAFLIVLMLFVRTRNTSEVL